MQVRVVSFQKFNNLSVVQLLTAQQNSFDYISGSTAIKEGLIQVNEISESGSVNNLFVFNLSDKFVFFMDGDILTGAKQNRVLNTSVLLAPNSKTTLPVSCVEQGRWEKVSDNFRHTDNISPQKIRALKSEAVKSNLRATKKYMADQMQVWDEVEKYQTVFNVKSSTMNLHEVYEKERENFESVIKGFKLNEDANGLAVYTDKKLLNVDVFNRTDIYQEYFPKILRSTAMDVLQLKNTKNELTDTEAIFKTVSLFDTLEKAPFTEHPGVSSGNEKRFDDEELTGFELSFQRNMIHLTLLNIEKKKSKRDNDYRWF